MRTRSFSEFLFEKENTGVEQVLNTIANLPDSNISVYLDNNNEIEDFGNKLKYVSFKKKMAGSKKRAIKDDWAQIINDLKKNGYGWFVYNSKAPTFGASSNCSLECVENKPRKEKEIFGERFQYSKLN